MFGNVAKMLVSEVGIWNIAKAKHKRPNLQVGSFCFNVWEMDNGKTVIWLRLFLKVGVVLGQKTYHLEKWC